MSNLVSSLPIPIPRDHPVCSPVSSYFDSPRSSVLSIDSPDNFADDSIEAPVLLFHFEALGSIEPQPPAALKQISHPMPMPIPIPIPIPQGREPRAAHPARRNLSTDSTTFTESAPGSATSSASASVATSSTSLPHSSSASVISGSSISSSSSTNSISRLDDRDLFAIPPAPLALSLPGVSYTGRYGEMYTDSMHFDDLPELLKASPNLNKSHISEFRVWSRNFVHGFQTKYELEGNPSSFSSDERKGKIHTAEYSMKIHSRLGEYIVGVEGTYREWIESLTIITNKQRYTFGRIARNGKFFRCAIPTGNRVVGFYGSFGVHLHNIGVYYQPISAADKSKRGSCFVERVKAAFRH